MFIYRYSLIDNEVCVDSISAHRGVTRIFPVRPFAPNEGVPLECFDTLNEDNTMFSLKNDDESKRVFLQALIEKESKELSELRKTVSSKEKYIKSLFDKIPPAAIYKYVKIKGDKDISISPCDAFEKENGYKVMIKTNFGTIVDTITNEELDTVIVDDDIAIAWSFNENLSADFLLGLPADW